MRTPIHRRTMLRGSGIAIALPMLEAMTPSGRAANDGQKPVKRFVCLSSNYGIYRESWFPNVDQTGDDYEMSRTLEPLERHRADMTVFSNLDHGNTIGHQGVPVLLSGVRPHLSIHYPEGNISVDQKIAELVARTKARLARDPAGSRATWTARARPGRPRQARRRGGLRAFGRPGLRLHHCRGPSASCPPSARRPVAAPQTQTRTHPD